MWFQQSVHLLPRLPAAQVPPVFDGEATREKLRKLQLQAPLTIHLRQEIDRWVGWGGWLGGLLSEAWSGAAHCWQLHVASPPPPTDRIPPHPHPPAG